MVGSRALSIQASNDIFIDEGAVFDLSASGTEPGPGGGSPGSGAPANTAAGVGGSGGVGGAGGLGGTNNSQAGSSGASGTAEVPYFLLLQK